MPDKLPTVPPVIVAVLLLSMIGTSLASAQTANNTEARPLAGQMCPSGSYVIGFDTAGNIVCSQVCGNGALDAGEDCDDGNTQSDDGCSASCQSESAAAGGQQDTVPAAQTAAAAAAAGAAVAVPAPSAPLAITDVEPPSVVFGTRELTIKISGTGFNSATVVLFAGSTYQPTVNATGTELHVTLPTRWLALGNYAIKVSNGSGEAVTKKKGLVVY
jgi:cysteine-rich repeat protein